MDFTGKTEDEIVKGLFELALDDPGLWERAMFKGLLGISYHFHMDNHLPEGESLYWSGVKRYIDANYDSFADHVVEFTVGEFGEELPLR